MSFFNFEQDFVTALRCIPMVVRFKLDTCGVKLKLEHWHQFTLAEREALVTRPCGTVAEIAAYGEALQTLVIHYNGQPAKSLKIDPHPPWLQEDQIPDSVQAQAMQFDVILSLAQWQSLTPLQRFALLKLSRPGHENRNFRPALAEFGLL
ncbi:nitrate reductase associated protein [Spirulina sp. CCNP1310]|uniref:nitrate reductase associated protein n=1 Tax=Spirulina sp. CCNP1310 TaxID=3110249 RepID=UPI002B1F1F3F|nr:nitrate reductase associated protein [Spirulina sp. CCNP1310]MEA5417739.1 nitrate reductase associated protein [Spirulina sp. CCNP1310]